MCTRFLINENMKTFYRNIDHAEVIFARPLRDGNAHDGHPRKMQNPRKYLTLIRLRSCDPDRIFQIPIESIYSDNIYSDIITSFDPVDRDQRHSMRQSLSQSEDREPN